MTSWRRWALLSTAAMLGMIGYLLFAPIGATTEKDLGVTMKRCEWFDANGAFYQIEFKWSELRDAFNGDFTAFCQAYRDEVARQQKEHPPSPQGALTALKKKIKTLEEGQK